MLRNAHVRRPYFQKPYLIRAVAHRYRLPPGSGVFAIERGRGMIRGWLDYPTSELFAALAAVYATTGALIVFISFNGETARFTRHLDGVVTPFFGAVGVLFALLTGFLANDVADRNRQAVQAVQSEAGELRNIYTLSGATVSEMHAIRAALSDYVNSLVKDEWPAMEEDRAAPSVSSAYDTLLQRVADPKIAQTASAAVHGALMNAMVRAGSARSERLALASDRTNEIKWILVLVLGVMTQISIGLVHLQKLGAQVTALTVFSLAVVMAVGMIALQERPFTGDIRVGPGPLASLARLPSP